MLKVRAPHPLRPGVTLGWVCLREHRRLAHTRVCVCVCVCVLAGGVGGGVSRGQTGNSCPFVRVQLGVRPPSALPSHQPLSAAEGPG